MSLDGKMWECSIKNEEMKNKLKVKNYQFLLVLNEIRLIFHQVINKFSSKINYFSFRISCFQMISHYMQFDENLISENS
jgi:hypothetical protein